MLQIYPWLAFPDPDDKAYTEGIGWLMFESGLALGKDLEIAIAFEITEERTLEHWEQMLGLFKGIKTYPFRSDIDTSSTLEQLEKAVTDLRITMARKLFR